MQFLNLCNLIAFDLKYCQDALKSVSQWVSDQWTMMDAKSLASQIGEIL